MRNPFDEIDAIRRRQAEEERGRLRDLDEERLARLRAEREEADRRRDRLFAHRRLAVAALEEFGIKLYGYRAIRTEVRKLFRTEVRTAREQDFQILNEVRKLQGIRTWCDEMWHLYSPKSTKNYFIGIPGEREFAENFCLVGVWETRDNFPWVEDGSTETRRVLSQTPAAWTEVDVKQALVDLLKEHS